MDDEFEKITEEMALEKELHSMYVRAAMAISIVDLCGSIYKEAKNVGLPRDVAKRMAVDFWDSETKTFVVVDERDEL